VPSRTKKPSSLRADGARVAHERVKTAKRRSTSSARWLERQLNDPYVAAAKSEGYRSRAAYKLIELDERFDLFHRGDAVVDLGAAPGSWTQVATECVGKGGGIVYAVDLVDIEPVSGAKVIHADLGDADAVQALIAGLEHPIDIVLSDMAPPATGHAATDHLRIVALCETAEAFAEEVLRPGGAFVAKVWQGGAERDFLARLKQRYDFVKHAKPQASRAGSAEMYLVAQGCRS
tara:strand:+ start:2342 stop:3040 length:699 start_codon:yes stop_codon:yes gene_type:complete